MKKNKMVQSNNAFVRKEQDRMMGNMGNRPGAPKEMRNFDAYMSNDGEGVKEFGRKLCRNMDDAFPLN